MKKTLLLGLTAMMLLMSASYGAENKFLSVGPSADGKGVTLTAKTGGGTKIDLYLTDAKGNITGKLSENQVKLSDKNFVEVSPAGEALEIRATMRFSFIPEFFSMDVLYDPALFNRNLLYIPAENFLIGVMENKNGFMALWPPEGKQVPMLVAEGKGETRRFTKMRVTFDKQKIYVAIMDHKAGIFPYVANIEKHKLDFSKPIHVSRKKLLYGELRTGWKFPFDAMWWTVLAQADSKKELGITSKSFAVDNPRHQWNDAEDATRWPSAVHAKDGNEWVLELEKRYWPYNSAITYPRTRSDKAYAGHMKRKFGYNKTTPGDIFTVTDVIFNTLGKNNYDKVIGREGIKNRWLAPTGEPWVYATCGGSWNLWSSQGFISTGYNGKAKPNKDKFWDISQGLVYFLNYGMLRVGEYRTMSEDIIKQCKDEAKKNPKLKVPSERIAAAAAKIEEIFLHEDEKYSEYVKKWRKKWSNVKAGAATIKMWPFLSDEEIKNISLATPQVPEKIRDWCRKIFDKHIGDKLTFNKINMYQGVMWKAAGAKMDGVLVMQRRNTKLLRQQAALACTESPEARAFALTVRKTAFDTMKYYHMKEGVQYQSRTANKLGNWDPKNAKRYTRMSKDEYDKLFKAYLEKYGNGNNNKKAGH